MARVCILLPSHWAAAKGGAELQAHTFADFLVRNTNHEVLYLTKRSPEENEYFSYPIRKISSRYPQSYGMFWDTSSLLRALASFGPELIIQRVACAYTGIAAFYSRTHSTKLIWHVSSDRDVSDQPQLPVGRAANFVDRVLFRFGVRNATAIVAQTVHQARVLKQNYGRGADAVIPNFAVAPEKAWTKSDRFTVVWIANLKPLKRPELLLQLARDLNSSEISFKVIGRRDSTPWCDSLIQRMCESPNVEYLGELELDEVNSLLERAHLLVNTSLYEGLPNTFIQAWLREVLTVTLGVDPDGMISASNLGYCATDYDALKAKVLGYATGRHALSDIGARARAFAIEKFSMSNAQELCNVIDQVLRLRK